MTITSRATPQATQLERRFRPRAVAAEDVWSLLGAMVAAIALDWMLYERVLPFAGGLGFWLCWYALFLLFYATVTAIVHDRRVVVDRLAAVVAGSSAVFALAVIIEQVTYVAIQGWSAVRHVNFYTQTMALAGPLQPLSIGGVLHSVIGSLEQLGIATTLAVPLGIICALFLAEIGGARAEPVRVIVTAMTALPEIIAGLFVYAIVIISLGTQQDGFAAGLALTVMMLPIVTRTAELMIRLVPNYLREASYALGASQWRTTWSVVLPTARSGITTATVLAMARAVGETAPVLLTSAATPFFNANPFRGPQSSLPSFIWDAARNAAPVMVQRAFGAALALMAMVLVLFIAARILGGRAPGELSRRQRRRIAHESTRSPRKGN